MIGWTMFCVAIAMPVVWVVSESKNWCRPVRMCLGGITLLSVALVMYLFGVLGMATNEHHYTTMLFRLANETECGNDDFVRKYLAKYKRGERLRGGRLPIYIIDAEMMQERQDNKPITQGGLSERPKMDGNMVPISFGWLLFYAATALSFVGWMIVEFKNCHHLMRMDMGILVCLFVCAIAFQIIDRIEKKKCFRYESVLLRFADESEQGNDGFVRKYLMKYKHIHRLNKENSLIEDLIHGGKFQEKE